MIASRCPHCGVPHEPAVTVCPTTGLAMPRGAPIPPAPAVPQRPRPEEAAPVPEPKRRQLIGRVIGDKYGVTGLIGEGGMGAVYEAEHLAIGRLVAVKVLHPKHAQKREAVTRLQHEARVVGSIGHPNICEVFDMGRLDDGSPYLVMERLHGETLAERIQRQGAVPYPELIDIMLQVLSALGAAHAKGIIHRDLKPDNIFLAQPPSGGPPGAKLLDFGISKAQAAMEETSMRLTRTGMVMGTPYYMAPEQARGERTLDQRVDLWAVGVLIYEALSGRRPFLAKNYNALLVQILTSKHRPLTEVVPGVPAGLSLVVDKALSKMREDRFQHAAEFQDVLIRVRSPASGSGTVVLYGRRATDVRRDGPPSTDRLPGQAPQSVPKPMSQPPRVMQAAAAAPASSRRGGAQAVAAGGPPAELAPSARAAPSQQRGWLDDEDREPTRRDMAPVRREATAPASSQPSRSGRDGRRSTGQRPVASSRGGSAPSSQRSPPRPVLKPPGPVTTPPRPSNRGSSPAAAPVRAGKDGPRGGKSSSQEDPTQPRIVVPRAPPIDPASISESLSGESDAEMRAVEDPTVVWGRGSDVAEITHRDSAPPPRESTTPSPDDDAPTFVQSYFGDDEVERTVVDPPSFSSLTGRGLEAERREHPAEGPDSDPARSLSDTHTPVRRVPAAPPSDGVTPVRRVPGAPRSDPKTVRSEGSSGSRKKKKK